MSREAVYLLGTPRLERDGAPVHITRRKVVALLAYLAVTGLPHNRESLVTLLSPELDSAHAHAEFRRTLAVLKHTLGPCHIQADRETVTLGARTTGGVPAPTAPGLWLDVAQFRALLALCQAKGHPSDPSGVCDACAPRLQEAVTLYSDDFMADFNLPDSLAFEEWQFFQAEALRELLSGALQRLIAWHSAQGKAELDHALAYARRWLALNPLHESAHRQLMSLYAQAGRRAAALRQYRECLRLLEEELGMPPSAETTALYQRIRAEQLIQRDAAQQPVSAIRPVSAPLPTFLSQKTAPSDAERPLFVARERELARLDGLLQAALKGHGQVAFVTGGPGRGKTALMEAFARRAMDAHPGLLVASGHCNAYSGAGDPYLPFRQALSLLSGDLERRYTASAIGREQARRLWEALSLTIQLLVEHGAPLIDTLLPSSALLSRAAAWPEGATAHREALRELAARAQQGAGERAQSRLFQAYEQLLRHLATQRPLLLLLDDLQWVDSASAQLLFHLGRELASGCVLMVGAYRPEEVALGRHGESHPLEKPLAEFRRTSGDVGLNLTRADDKEGRAFVDAYLDSEPNRLGESFRAALHAHTGGHPLFTIELLRAMQARGDLVLDAQGRWTEGPALDWTRLPARVEGVIQARVDRLDEALRDILSIASVEGEIFTVQVLAAVQRSDEHDLLRALSRRLEGRHRLVQELKPISLKSGSLYRYRFSHALFQQYLYNVLSTGERALLHREVAQALETLYRGQTGAIAVPLAHHYAQAGAREKAIHFSLLAGDQARLAYAHDQATAHYKDALALQKEMGDHDGAARTLMKLGLAHHNAFQFAASRQAYDEGFRLWQHMARPNSTRALPPAPHALRLIAPPFRTLDPTLSRITRSWDMIYQLFSGLLELTPELEAVPDVARSWEVSPDGRRYLFHLRDDARWSDDVTVTAADFAFSWKRTLDPATAAPDAGFLYDIQGAEAFHQGESRDQNSVGVRARGRFTLEVALEQPVAYFPLLVARMYPVPRHVVAAHGEAWTAPEHLVTNGPFRLESWDSDGSMVFVRNPGYPGRFSGNVGRVELTPPPEDRSLILQMYVEDRVHHVEDVTAIMRGAQQLFPDDFVSLPILRTAYLAFNMRKPPFDDRRVRRAFVLATDRKKLMDVSPPGGVPATGGLVPPGMPGHVPDLALPYDPERARRLLAEAGYGGRSFPQVEFMYIDKHIRRAVSAEAAREWRENLGIEVQLHGIPGMDYLIKRLRTDPPDMFVSGWNAHYPDPDTFLRVFVSREAAGWHDDTYQRLIAQARRLTDQAARMALYHRAQRILVEEAPIVPIYYQRTVALVKPWIKRFPAAPIGRDLWKNVIIEPH